MNKLSMKFSSIALSVATVVSLAGVAVPVAHAQTTAELQAQIAALLAQITALQTQLSGGGSSASVTFTKDLTLGSTGGDVTALQSWLVSKGHLTMPAGVAMGYFGNLTKAAVAKYQAAKGISPAVGYFGPKTRAAVNAEAGSTAGGGTGGTGTTGTVPSGNAVSVSLASDNPAATTIGSGTAFNPALKVVLTAGANSVTVSSLTLSKSGFLANTNLNGVDVVDSKGVRHGNVVTSINADNTVLLTMPSDPVTIAAGASETLTIRFNLNSGNLNGTVAFGIAGASAVGAGSATVSGTFPVNGNVMSVTNGGTSLASSSLDVLTSTGSSTLSVDSANPQEITRFRVKEEASNEGMYLRALTLYNYGNAGDQDYRDVTLEDLAGVVQATAQPKGQYVYFALANPYFVDKGQTKDFIVRAKLTGGTTKTLNLVVYNNYDIDLRGASTMVSVIPAAGTNDTSFPVGNGFNIQTIGSGTLTFNKASDSPSSAVVPNASGVTLAKYNANPTGENMELRQVSFYIATSSTGAATLTGTVYVKVNGAIVYSAGASSIVGTSATTFTLSTYPILAKGVNNPVTVETSIPSGAGSNDTYTVKAFDLIQVKRLVTLDLLDPSVTATDANQISVSAANLSVTTLATPVANTVVTGITQVELATIQLNAQAGGEDVNVSKIVVTQTGTAPTDISNLALYKDGENTPLTTTGSTATGAATITFNLTSPILVTRTTPVTLHFKGDITGSGANAHTFNVASSSGNITAVGAATGNTLTHGSQITFAGGGQAQTIAGSGTLTLSLLSGTGATPTVDQVANVGTTNGTYLAFKMTSQYEAQKITAFKVTATSSGATALATSSVVNIKLYEGTNSSPFAQASQFDSCASGQCTVNFTASDNLLSAAVPTTGVNIYVKADVGPAGSASLGDNFKLLVASTSDVSVKGALTATTTATKTGTPTAAGSTFIVPAQVAIEAVSPTAATQVGLSSGQTLGVFKVMNNGSAPVYATSVWTFANSGAATTSVTFSLLGSEQGGTSGDVSITYATGSTSGGATGASSTIPFGLATSGVSEANRTINGGTWRYFTIRSSGVAANNDTFAFSVSALGNLTFAAKESDLGYSGNAGTGDNDLSDTINGLRIDGKPSLATVTAKT